MATPSRLNLIVVKRVMYLHSVHGPQPDNCPIWRNKTFSVFSMEYTPDQILRQMVGVEEDSSCNSRLCWLQCKLDCPAKKNVLKMFQDVLCR